MILNLLQTGTEHFKAFLWRLRLLQDTNILAILTNLSIQNTSQKFIAAKVDFSSHHRTSVPTIDDEYLHKGGCPR